MLARRLDGVVVIAGRDRYAAGRLAESKYGCTVHILDDGFQHLRLHRDLDIVLVAADDIARPATLPTGRLREPLDALSRADGIVALDGADAGTAARSARVWRARRHLERARLAGPPGGFIDPPPCPVVAVAGIAHPDRFFADLRGRGWSVARAMPFRDHHPYTRDDVEQMLHSAREERAGLIVTTEKDVVRLLRFRPFPVPIAFIPMTLAIEDADRFDVWMMDALRRARVSV
jgi:tetraacyldisaccharide 4'-kinase